MNAIIGDIGIHFLIEFMALACAAGLIAGVALIVQPAWLAQLGKHANRWISTRRPSFAMESSLERWVNLDDWFHRNNRISGSLMLIGCIWVIGYFLMAFDRHAALAVLLHGSHLPAQMIAGLLESFIWICLAGASIGVVVGLLMWLRPGLLRGMELGANQWHSLRKTLKPVEIPRSGVDEYVMRNGRLAGALLLLGSIYILGMLLLLLK